ncbi:MAG: hypothetical protein COB35_09265 [Gammaproteobacteria bacterium]|nr:MAG: hypothetical protein COB35_09265 [Gammaproteobacteria bacterium]
MITMLTKGWFGRIIILLLWLAGMSISLNIADEVNGLREATLLLFNCSFYFMVAMRLPKITLMQSSYLLPNYFSQLKRSLAILLFISFIPLTVLLPDVVAWLNALSISTLLAMLIVTIVYQPKYSFLFIILMFLPVEVFNLTDEYLFTLPFSFSQLMAVSLPLILFSAFKFVDKLENYRGDVKQIALFMSMSSFSMEKVLADQEQLPEKSRNKFSQWLLTFNVNYYLYLINKTRSLSNKQLIAIACQSVSSMGRGTYLFWFIVISLICSVGLYLGENYYHYFIPAMVIFPTIMIGSGTLTFFHIIYGKKAYLARLSIMPNFENNNSFVIAFLSFVIWDQIKLYAFMSLALSAFALIFGFLTSEVLVSVITAAFTLCMLNLGLMILGWCRKKAQDSVFTWIIFSGFMLFVVFLFIVADNKINLLQSAVFSAFLLFCLTIFVLSIYRSFQKIPHWLS